MANANDNPTYVSFKRGTVSNLATESVDDGAMLVATDANRVSFDIGNNRKTIISGDELINYSSSEPSSNLVANKTVWIG